MPSGPGEELLVLVVASCMCLCVIVHLCGDVGSGGCICFGCWCGPERAYDSRGVCRVVAAFVSLVASCCGVGA